MTVEICIDSVASALAAQAGGAQRVELCDNLMEGGTTPSAGTITVVRAQVQIGLQVMIRPRGGDFCYSDLEFAVMRHDIATAKSLGVDGIVLGLLTPDGRVDAARTRELIAAARPLNVTFHRAFDVARDPREALETLVELDVDRVLTSGQEPTAYEGIDLIAELVRQAAGRISIVAGGGIHERNAGKIVAQTGVREIHFTGRRTVPSAMQYRNERVFMGGELRPPEFDRSIANAERIARIIGAARG
ncbi:MAG: copper homeostasis protein CutC [Chloroflexi bacterium]|nr:copper homeostasis protein CutC [Chloroflexota bacterium]